MRWDRLGKFQRRGAGSHIANIGFILLTALGHSETFVALNFIGPRLDRMVPAGTTARRRVFAEFPSATQHLVMNQDAPIFFRPGSISCSGLMIPT
jgi:hypothetical protein